MINTTFRCFFIAITFIVCVNSLTSYEGFQLHEIKHTANETRQAIKFLDFINTNPQLKIDIFSQIILSSKGGSIQYMVPPESRQNVVEFVASNYGRYPNVVNENVEATLIKEREELIASREDCASFFDCYHTLSEMQRFLNDLASANPKLATPIIIGTTHEDRSIFGIRITNSETSAPNGEEKPEIFYNGGQHAREWISPITICYIANTLLNNYTSNPDVKELVDKMEWTLVPVVNADGYQYTWDENRLWRKNRQPNQGSTCVGTDTNRNWNFHWDGINGGSSTSKCSETYRGPSPFSAPENKAVAQYISERKNVQGYIDFHAYGQLFMSPYGYTKQLPPADDYNLEDKLMEQFTTAIKKVHNKNYKYGSVADTIYVARGGSNDWTYGSCGIVYSFAIELRPFQGSIYGFQLPADQIVPQGQEIVAAVAAMGQFILANPVPQPTLSTCTTHT